MVLFNNIPYKRMRLTSKVILTKRFSEKFKRMCLTTRLYGILVDTFIATHCMKNIFRLLMTAAVIVILVNTVFDKHSLQTVLSILISFMP